MIKKVLSISLMLFFSTALKASFLPNTFKSEISQSYKSQIKGKERKSSGFIEYQYPGHLILSVEGKNNFTLVMNEKTSWYYQPPFMEGMNGEVSIGETKSSPLYESLNLLRHGLKSNKFYKVVTKKGVEHLLIPEKMHKQFGIKEIRLHFKDQNKKVFNNLNLMELFPVGQEKVSISFKNTNEKVKFSKDHFVFKIPANTNINGQKSEAVKKSKKGI